MVVDATPPQKRMTGLHLSQQTLSHTIPVFGFIHGALASQCTANPVWEERTSRKTGEAEPPLCDTFFQRGKGKWKSCLLTSCKWHLHFLPLKSGAFSFLCSAPCLANWKNTQCSKHRPLNDSRNVFFQTTCPSVGLHEKPRLTRFCSRGALRVLLFFPSFWFLPQERWMHWSLQGRSMIHRALISTHKKALLPAQNLLQST